MTKHKETGIKGELIAQNFLQKKGYQILYTNWRNGQKEIDIITTINTLLVFVEVKTRANYNYGYPEEAVTPKKQTFLKAAADAFLLENQTYEEIRFDIISILLEKDTIKEIKHIEDAFF